MDEIFPVGLIPLLHVPGPHPATAPTLVYELLRPLVRRRALESFGSVLVVGRGEDSLGAALERLVPTATVTTVDAAAVYDPAPGSADLVIAHDVLPSMQRDQQIELLGAVRTALHEGGYVLATVLGELVRPFVSAPQTLAGLETDGISDRDPAGEGTVQTRDYTLEAYSGVFEVLDYLKGGVASLNDLVVLRKT
jgi:hypothetical protein